MLDHTCRLLLLPDAEISSDARVDAFCVLTGLVQIKRLVHVAAGCRLIGSGGKILLDQGSFVSHGSTLLTGSDDYSGEYAISPCFPERLRNVTYGDVTLEPMSGCGAHCVIMPGVTLGFGARLAANSFLMQSIPPGEIWGGTPARRLKKFDLERLAEIYCEVFAPQFSS